jgi:hypothetical protein
LDKLHNIDRTVDNLAKVLNQILGSQGREIGS